MQFNIYCQSRGNSESLISRWNKFLRVYFHSGYARWVNRPATFATIYRLVILL